jgi:hypothetical protein
MRALAPGSGGVCVRRVRHGDERHDAGPDRTRRKAIARTDAEIAAATVLVLVLVGLISMPAWVPVALTRVAPGPSQHGLASVRDQIARRGRGFTVGLLSRRAVLHRTRAHTAARLMMPPQSRRSAIASRAASAASRFTPSSVVADRLSPGPPRRGNSAALSLSPGRDSTRQQACSCRIPWRRQPAPPDRIAPKTLGAPL